MMNSNSSNAKNGHSDDWPLSTGTPAQHRSSFPSLCFFFISSTRLANFYSIIPSTTRLRDSMAA
jgi:hypothetical protein